MKKIKLALLSAALALSLSSCAGSVRVKSFSLDGAGTYSVGDRFNVLEKMELTFEDGLPQAKIDAFTKGFKIDNIILEGSDSVSIEADGTIICEEEGTGWIEVELKIDSSISAKYEFVIYPTLDGIEVANVNITMTVGETRQIVVAPNPQNALVTGYKFVSDSTAVSISDKGLVTAMEEGEAEVLVLVGGFEQRVGISVRKVFTEFSVVDAPSEVHVGDTFKLDYNVDEVTAILGEHKLMYETLDEGVLSVDENGNYRAVAVGVTTIRIYVDGFTSADYTQEITVSAAPIIPATKPSTGKPAGGGTGGATKPPSGGGGDAPAPVAPEPAPPAPGPGPEPNAPGFSVPEHEIPWVILGDGVGDTCDLTVPWDGA